jgi:type VI secretion system protein ImpL
MLAEAAGGRSPIRFNQMFEGSAAAVRNDYEIPAGFTRDGWQFVHTRLASGEPFMQADDWVLPGQTPSDEDQRRLAGQLRTRYERDYVDRWLTFLDSTAVVVPAGATRAAQTLGLLSDRQSPLLQLFYLVSENTVIDSLTVLEQFAPLHVVTPADTAAPVLVGPNNEPYVAGLQNLQFALEDVGRGGGETASSDARNQARDARRAVTTLAQSFPSEGEAASVGRRIEQLMVEPIRRVEGMLGRLPRDQMNAQGVRFCRDFNRLMRRFPFNPSGQDATLDEVAAVFHPQTGRIRQFYDETLSGLLAQQGSRYAVAPGASLRPTSSFVNFFNAADAVSRAMYDQAGEGPFLSFAIRPLASQGVPSVTFNMDGRTQTNTQLQTGTGSFRWVGGQASETSLSGQIAGRAVEWRRWPGTWGVFRLFFEANWLRSDRGRHSLEWVFAESGRADTVRAELQLGDPTLLRPGYFGALGCQSRIVR